MTGLERQLNEETCRIQHHINTADQTGDVAQVAIDGYQVNDLQIAINISLSVQHDVPKLVQRSLYWFFRLVMKDVSIPICR
jgi:hypothetical protein